MMMCCDQAGCKAGETFEIQPVQSTTLTEEEEKLCDHLKWCIKKKDKIQDLFMKRTLSKLGTEGRFLTLIEGIYLNMYI